MAEKMGTGDDEWTDKVWAHMYQHHLIYTEQSNN